MCEDGHGWWLSRDMEGGACDVSYLNVLSRYSPEETDENHEKTN
jgi:hypothetical protein